MSHMNKRTVRKYVCTACNVNAVKSFGARCRPCIDKPFIEAAARQAEHNARLKAEYEREWSELRNKAKSNNRLPAVPSSMSETRLASFIAAPVGVWLAFEGHELGWFLVLGSLTMIGLMSASDWWDRRHIRAYERKIKELKRKL